MLRSEGDKVVLTITGSIAYARRHGRIHPFTGSNRWNCYESANLWLIPSRASGKLQTNL